MKHKHQKVDLGKTFQLQYEGFAKDVFCKYFINTWYNYSYLIYANAG